MIRKHLRKTIQQFLLSFYTLKNENMPAYISKTNLNCEKQIILLIIPNEEK